ncbi:MAG: hypothetical protein JW795_17730, partial [Chitinivibrionales bacterium]|nr:hypothetical protein [Chitinivibrionales bacterium]
MKALELLFLIPLVAAVLLAVMRNHVIRGAIVKLSSAVIAAVSVYVAFLFTGKGTQFFPLDYPWLEQVTLGAEALIILYLLYRCKDIAKSEWWIPVLILAQAGVAVMTKTSGEAPHVSMPLYIDSFSIIMVLIIGIIGTLICVYAVSYLHDYHHHHKEVKDRQCFFFFLFFLFLSGMFGVVLCNHLEWLFLSWEITTLCSFELIGYSQNEEAKRNSFRALGFNSLGGLAFSIAILYLVKYSAQPTLQLSTLISFGAAGALIPAVLISFAGITKSAQMPFTSWLLGAMVAPTPVSALLHSSTMVKAGVFVIVKFAPVLQNTIAGHLVALVGGITFLMTSLLAVTQSNSKRVLAYSTTANLGLVVMCAGVGSKEAVVAAILLIIYHAVAKGLLFLTVGT